MTDDSTDPATPVDAAAPTVDTTVTPVTDAATVESAPVYEADAAAQSDALHAEQDHAYDLPGVNASTDAAVSGGSTDDVHLSSCVYKNLYVRKSLTIHHLQRRLNELGFSDAYADEDGFYGDLTQLSVQNFQKSKGFEVTEVIDANTFNEVFMNDVNVVIIID